MANKPRLRILVADDHSDLAASFAFLLEVMGYEARLVFDARYIVTKVDEFRPDVAFVDIAMVDADGVNIARLLREHYARHELPIVATSAYCDPRTRDPKLTAGFDAHVTKPASRQDVDTILGLVLERQRERAG